jgi:hypothetical protein
MRDMKYLKNIYSKMLVVIITVAMIACNPSDFGDLNDDPNNTTTPQTSGLLTSALRQLPITTAGNNGRDYRHGNLMVQYVGNTQYVDDDNWNQVNFDFNGLYAGAMADLALIVKINEDPETAAEATKFGSNGNQIAAAKTVMAALYYNITNRFGDIPFTDALKASADPQILSPVYDSQQAVYNGIFQLLDDAKAAIDAGDGPDGDILFGGDMAAWRAYGASIRMVAALNLSKADNSLGQTQFNIALSDGIASEGVYYQFLAESANENPWFSAFRTREDWSVTATITDYMQSTSFTNPFSGDNGKMDVAMDPRLPYYCNPVEESLPDIEFIGQPYGLTTAEAGAISNSSVSILGNFWRQQDLNFPIISKEHLLFCRAEAAQMNWTSENAQTLYYDAIRASLEYYGEGDAYDTFITNSEVAWDPSQAMYKISMQKWVALFLRGFYGWDNWRRTGIPDLKYTSVNGINSKTIPTRLAYPTTERDLNGDNWSAAISQQGFAADDLNGILWVYR